MENFVKYTSELINGVITVDGKLAPRSLVFHNQKSNAVINITAKCRNSDKFSVARCVAKAFLAAKREEIAQNSTEAAKESKKRVSNPMPSALGCHVVYLTDKNGNIIPESGVTVEMSANGELTPLRSVFRFTKTQPLYKLVVEEGKDWADEAVANALKAWATAATEQLDFYKRLDAALEKAADNTEKVEKAEEKAAKEAEKAKATKNAA